MANDRLILHSSNGKEIVIAKHFGGSWNLTIDDFEIDDFFEDDFIENGRGFYYLTNELYSSPESYDGEFIDDYDRLYYTIHNMVLYTLEIDKLIDIEKRIKYVLKNEQDVE